MPMTSALRNYLKASKIAEPRILFEISVALGSTPLVLRYCTDNEAITYNSVTWSPFPVETQDFIKRMSDGSNLLELVMFDPDDVQMPGPIKALLQYEGAIGRTTFTMYLVFMDEVPGGGGAKFFENTANTIELYKGGLDTATFNEDAVAFNLENLVDGLDNEMPKAQYTSTCPYRTGDANCTRLAGGLTPTLQSAENCSATSFPSTSSAVVSDLNSTAGRSATFWTNGIVIFNSGNLRGVVRTITNCAQISPTQWTLTFDEPISGGVTSMTNIGCILRANCVRTYSDCQNRFSNGLNFGGFQSVVKVVGNYTVPVAR